MARRHAADGPRRREPDRPPARLDARLVGRIHRHPSSDARVLRGAAEEARRSVAAGFVAGRLPPDGLGPRARALGAGREALVAARPDVLGGPDAADPGGRHAVAAALRRGAQRGRRGAAGVDPAHPRRSARGARRGLRPLCEARDRRPDRHRAEAARVDGGTRAAPRPGGARARRLGDGDGGRRAGLVPGLARGPPAAAAGPDAGRPRRLRLLPPERRPRAVHARGDSPHGTAGVRPVGRPRGLRAPARRRRARSPDGPGPGRAVRDDPARRGRDPPLPRGQGDRLRSRMAPALRRPAGAALPRGAGWLRRVDALREHGAAGRTLDPLDPEAVAAARLLRFLDGEGPPAHMSHEGIPGHAFQLALALAERGPDPPLVLRLGPDRGARVLLRGAASLVRPLRGRAEGPGNGRELHAPQGAARRGGREARARDVHDSSGGRVPQDQRPDGRGDGAGRGRVLRDLARAGDLLQIGKLQVLRLLAEAKKAQGDAFRLRAFHDFVYKNGNVPLALQRWELLGQEVDHR